MAPWSVMINKHKYFAQITFVQIDQRKEKEKQLIGDYWNIITIKNIFKTPNSAYFL